MIQKTEDDCIVCSKPGWSILHDRRQAAPWRKGKVMVCRAHYSDWCRSPHSIARRPESEPFCRWYEGQVSKWMAEVKP